MESRWVFSSGVSDMRKHKIERPGHLREIQGVDQQGRVLDLSAAARPHEAPKLLNIGPCLLRGLLLERSEGSKLTLRVDDLFHRGDSESPDQLVLQVCDAHVEPECLHVGPSEVGAMAGPLESAPKVALLAGVAEAREPDIQPLRAVEAQEASNVRRTSDRHDGNALSVKTPPTAPSEGFQRTLVADPFNKDDRVCFDHAALPVSRPRARELPVDGIASAIRPMGKVQGPWTSRSKLGGRRTFRGSIPCLLM
jgi:hypothetical protein